ncbi:MAG: DUF3761 domain-containing protein [Candidatus Paceibacterota bacterium]
MSNNTSNTLGPDEKIIDALDLGTFKLTLRDWIFVTIAILLLSLFTMVLVKELILLVPSANGSMTLVGGIFWIVFSAWLLRRQMKKFRVNKSKRFFRNMKIIVWIVAVLPTFLLLVSVIIFALGGGWSTNEISTQQGITHVRGYYNDPLALMHGYADPPRSISIRSTAQCRDGTFSFGLNQSNSCSHRGGVSRWLNN